MLGPRDQAGRFRLTRCSGRLTGSPPDKKSLGGLPTPGRSLPPSLSWPMSQPRYHEGITEDAVAAISAGGDSHSSRSPFKTTSKRTAFMAQHPQPKWQAKERGEHEKADHRECENEVLSDPAAGQAAEPDGERQSPEVIADQHDVGHLQGDIRARGAHGDPNMGGGQGGGVIHAVADHRDEVACVHYSLQFDHLLVG